ncbi:MAG: translocation/assembly module TamB [Acidobacteria bacterium]|nr:translocation/assembly module TamB [Acidobacteriota bacterium]
MLLTGVYYSLKYFIYTKINERLTDKISFNDINFSIFPLNIRVNNLKNFPIKDENLVSFKNISLEFSFWSLFSNIKKVHLNIHNPRILLNDKIFSKEKKTSAAKMPFEIDRINISDGELIYNSSDIIVNLLNFNLSSFTGSGQAMYRLDSPHLKIIFSLSKNVNLLQLNGTNHESIEKKIIRVEGDMESEVRFQPTSWKVSSFIWNTREFRVDVNGRIFKDGSIALNAALHGTPDVILLHLLKEFSPLGYMEGNFKIRRQRKEKLFIQAEFGYNNFNLGGEIFDSLKGTFEWNSENKHISVTNRLQDGPVQGQVKVEVTPAVTRVQIANILAEKGARIIKIADVAPLRSIVKQGEVEIERDLDGREIIKGTASFSPYTPGSSTISNTLFNVGGIAAFEYHPDTKYVHVYAENLQTEFGPVPSLEVTVDNAKEHHLSIKSAGKITDLAGINRYTDYYIDLDLSRWKLKDGVGNITFTLEKNGPKTTVDSKFEIRNFTTSGQFIDLLTGHIYSRNGDGLVAGDFSVTDKDVGGDMKLLVNKNYFTMDLNKLQGESQKILKILEIDLSLYGRMIGDFSVYKKSREPLPLIKGKFQAGQLNFYNFIFNDVYGDLEFQRSFSLKNLQYLYKNGKGNTDIFIDFADKKYQLSGKIENIDLNGLNPEFNGLMSVHFKGQGGFYADPIKFEFKSGDIRFFEDRKFIIKGRGNVFTDFANFRLDTQGDILNAHEPSPFNFGLTKENKNFSGSFHVDLSDINMLIPWGNNIGKMTLDGLLIGDANKTLTAEGHAEFKGPILSFPNFPHALENFEGDIIFKDLHFTLRSLKGTMGGGKVESSGYLYIDNNKLTDFSINLVGKNMNLYIIDRTNFLMNADLNLKYMAGKLLLSGNMKALSGIWKREIDEGISFNTDPSLSTSGSRIMDMLEYDLRLTGGDNLLMENSFGSITGKFDLRLTGNKNFPILTGFIDSQRGKINFSDKKFDLVKARIVFNNKFIIDPMINIEAETFIKDYRIKFNIKGTASRIKPELQSIPPLPPRDILTLISLGELFERPTSTELSSQIGTGTTGLIASGLTEEIKKRTKKIFGNYMLKIDPNISNIAGASFEDTSRLIVGKEISKDFLVVYATNFSTKRREVIYLQYQLSPSVSLIGMRNENRQFSLDLRFRKRH